jgi:hypothetical protein
MPRTRSGLKSAPVKGSELTVAPPVPVLGDVAAVPATWVTGVSPDVAGRLLSPATTPPDPVPPDPLEGGRGTGEVGEVGVVVGVVGAVVGGVGSVVGVVGEVGGVGVVVGVVGLVVGVVGVVGVVVGVVVGGV